MIQVLFMVIAAVGLAAALGTILARNLVRAALYLVAFFFMVACLFVLLEAEFLAALQVLVYIGAVAIILMFGIMLTKNIQGDDPSSTPSAWQVPGLVAGLGVSDLSENGFALGWDYIKLPHPVFPGDTLYSESEVISVRESKSRPAQGVVKVRTRGLNQDGVVVIEYERSIMVWKKAHAPLMALFPEPKHA